MYVEKYKTTLGKGGLPSPHPRIKKHTNKRTPPLTRVVLSFSQITLAKNLKQKVGGSSRNERDG